MRILVTPAACDIRFRTIVVLMLLGCRIALRVDREVRSPDGEVVSHDVRYFIASLDPDRVTAADLLQHARDHWKVENGLHFVKARWWTKIAITLAAPAPQRAWRQSTTPPSRFTDSAPTPASSPEPPPTISPGTPPSASHCSIPDFAVVLLRIAKKLTSRRDRGTLHRVRDDEPRSGLSL